MWHQRRLARRGGFTLVELIVVVGVIAVLIGILMPALLAARRQANTVACAAHLREIARGYALYAQENRGVYPWASLNYTPRGGGQQKIITWDDLISRYVGVGLTQAEMESAYAPREAEVFTCPEDNVERQAYGVALVAGQAVHRRSYGVSCWVGLPDAHAMFEGVGGESATGEPLPWDLMRKLLCVKVEWVPAPATTILAFDMPASSNNLGGFFAYAGRPYDQIVGYTGVARLGTKGVHGKKYNYAFCDGHVEALLAQDTVRPGVGSTWYYETNSMWTRNPRD